ncbi:unnamed protein product [Parajaminaea phylloscopi]
MAPSLPSLSSLAVRWSACRGDVPPPLVGASTAVVSRSSQEEHHHTVGQDAAPTDKLYLFGGRLVSSRKMTNDMYALDLETLVWEKIDMLAGEADQGAEQQARPEPRYFHSCDVWNGKLIMFGGMGHDPRNDAATGANPAADKSEHLCAMDQVFAFDLATRRWELDFALPQGEAATVSVPLARYAHLSSITGDYLVIIGGQDVANQYMGHIHVFDLKLRHWIASTDYQRQCGSYRSLAVGASWIVEQGQPLPEVVSARIDQRARSGSNRSTAAPTALASVSEQTDEPVSIAGELDTIAGQTAAISLRSNTEPRAAAASTLPQGQSLGHLRTLPMSRPTLSSDDGSPVYMYSNYNFTDVKRELEVVTVSKGSGSSSSTQIDLEDRSFKMAGNTLPPGLRFPTGYLVGEYLIVSGTYLANTSQMFAVWTLHLPSHSWTRLDAGAALQSGSWNRAVLWSAKNQLVVFGNRDRDLVTDYNQRQTNWDHVLSLDLETWGISRPPMRPMSDLAISAGLDKLASAVRNSSSVHASNGRRRASSILSPVADRRSSEPQTSSKRQSQIAEGSPVRAMPGVLAMGGDFEILCSDGVKLACDRALLEARWPWFRQRFLRYRKQAKAAAGLVIARRPMGPTGESSDGAKTPRSARDRFQALLQDPATPISSPITSARQSPTSGMTDALSPHSVDCRFLPRQLEIPEPSPVVLALLQFFYTQCFCTPLQRHPAIVASCLILSRIYALEDSLGIWARHAALDLLNGELFPDSVAQQQGVWEGKPRKGGPSTQLEDETALAALAAQCHRYAVALYEAAALAEYDSLQVRALRTVYALSRHVQRYPAARSSGEGRMEARDLAEEVSGRRTPAQAAISGASGLSPTTEVPSSSLSMAPHGWTGERGHSPAPGVGGPAKAARLLGLQQSKVERRLGITAEEARLGQSMGRSSPLPAGFESEANSRPFAPAAPLTQFAPPGAPSSGNNLLRPDATRVPSMSKKRFSIFGRSASGTTNAEDADNLTRIASTGSGSTSGEQPQTLQQARSRSLGSEQSSSASVGLATSPSPSTSQSSTPTPKGSAVNVATLPPPALSAKEAKRLAKLEKKRAEAQAKAAAKSSRSLSPDAIVAMPNQGDARPRIGGNSSSGSSTTVKASPPPPAAFFSI